MKEKCKFIKDGGYMKKIGKISLLFMVAAILTFMVSCKNATEDSSSDDNKKQTTENNDELVSWDSEPNGTLKITNNTAKDMVVFNGQTPTVNTILGGIKAGSNRFFDISDDVDDFSVGGYLVLRAMAYDEFLAKKTHLSNAKIEFSAMATYGQGKKFAVDINPEFSGDYYFKVTNMGRIGIELRKDSADGEKIGYLPALATNYALYSDSSNGITIFPVYVYFNKRTGNVTTIKAKDHFASVTVGPRPVTDSTVTSIELPAEGIKWEDIVGNLSSPVAYITCTNNVTNQGAYFTKAATTRLSAQNGYDLLNAGETNTYEIESTDAGTAQNLIVTLYNGAIKVPVKDAEGNAVLIKNGYDYTVTISFNGSDVRESSNYSAVITEGEKRDISEEIESL